MSIKLTYTTEDGATFDTANKARIHDAIKQTGVYLESYKMKDIVDSLDQLIIVEYRQFPVTEPVEILEIVRMEEGK